MRNRLSWIALSHIGLAACALLSSPAHAQPRASTFAAIGARTTMPYGWMDFCRRLPSECAQVSAEALDTDLQAPSAWATLERVNRQVNARVEPVTDEDQYGVEDFWTYPTSGKGDCEDYVLQKRKLLKDAGFPVESLLITVVRDDQDEGHAVLTVKTTMGEYVLDNKREAILPWTQTGYRFVKRQSQTNPNVWLQIGPPNEAVVASTATRSRRR